MDITADTLELKVVFAFLKRKCDLSIIAQQAAWFKVSFIAQMAEYEWSMSYASVIRFCLNP